MVESLEDLLVIKFYSFIGKTHDLYYNFLRNEISGSGTGTYASNFSIDYPTILLFDVSLSYVSFFFLNFNYLRKSL